MITALVADPPSLISTMISNVAGFMSDDAAFSKDSELHKDGQVASLFSCFLEQFPTPANTETPAPLHAVTTSLQTP